MRLRKITDVKNLNNKRVLVRVDFNVPVEKGRVQDDYKIRKSLPTIKYLSDRGAIVILVSHLGRPKTIDKKLSLIPVAKCLEKLLSKKVKFCNLSDYECSHDNDELILIENIRFFPEEEKNGIILAKELASLADLFVLDGFAVAHRESASVSGVAKYLPAYAGLLMVEEINGLERATSKAKKPLLLILGGAKTETKIPVLQNFLKKADKVLIGGGILTTLLAARGYKIGGSIVDKENINLIKNIGLNKKIVMPVDVVVGKINGKDARVVSLVKLPRLLNDEAIYDVGPATVRLFSKYIKTANTLIWNGALGKFETHPYEYGTYSLARLFSGRSKGLAFGVVGGGETVEIFENLNLAGDVDLVSTGGGAMLEYLAGKDLPGIKILKKFNLFNLIGRA